MTPLRICLIASSRFPVAEPFVGGLEAHTHALAGALKARGHEVSLFAGPGSDPALGVHELDVAVLSVSQLARADVGAAPEEWMREHHAYLSLMLDLSRTGADRFDVVHNNSLHHLPVAMASAIEVPIVTTLHTPPTPWLESAMILAPHESHFVAVSSSTSESWAHAVPSTVIMNGVDTGLWRPGPGGERAIWFGRLVPEKAPHLAIEAARLAGIPIDLAGPILDRAYFSRCVSPLLGEGVRYLGHLDHAQLVDVVGSSCVTVATPVWDEPYGLVAAESLACGTPVAAFAMGALPEIVDDTCGRLAVPGDTASLAEAMKESTRLSRDDARSRALEFCSLDRMVDQYERLYLGLAGTRAA
ncbi:MAG: glycosyltransferase family 4 protein [Microbacteriaceae bacterium]|nr:glycosyltransferase family 4 protein [Microbacteriaceae bacterium]